MTGSLYFWSSDLIATTSGSNSPMAAEAVLFMRSDVKVAIPHFLGGNEEINTTFFGGPFVILSTPFLNSNKMIYIHFRSNSLNCQANWLLNRIKKCFFRTDELIMGCRDLRMKIWRISKIFTQFLFSFALKMNIIVYYSTILLGIIGNRL